MGHSLRAVELNQYFIKYSDRWHLIEDSSILDVLMQLARDNGYYTELFENAFRGCDAKYYIDMYNQFVPPLYEITGVYVINAHLYGDYE